MAAVLETPPFNILLPPCAAVIALKSVKPFSVCFRHRRIPRTTTLRFGSNIPFQSVKFAPFFASNGGETETTHTQEQVQEPSLEDSPDGSVTMGDDADGDDKSDVEEMQSSVVISLLQSYREALGSKDESKIAEIEAFVKSIEDEKIDLEKKVASMAEELSAEKDRILRISADFDNFRKRTERERLSLVTNAQGEVLENLLPVLDNFERAKAQIKVESEGEEKINNSYQSIYKQFVEILGALGVMPVETVGEPFDPMLHEAIMREDSSEYEEGVILEEYRKGFKIGDRLLRPSMVKVSAGPGPAKPEQVEPLDGEGETDAGEGAEGSEAAEEAADRSEAESTVEPESC